MVVFGLYSCRQKYESNVIHKNNSFIEKNVFDNVLGYYPRHLYILSFEIFGEKNNRLFKP